MDGVFSNLTDLGKVNNQLQDQSSHPVSPKGKRKKKKKREREREILMKFSPEAQAY